MLSTGEKIVIIILSVIVVIAILFGLFVSITPTGKAFINTWRHSVKKADDVTKYETLKQVEDTCRSMIATYNRNKVEYENNYKNYLDALDKMQNTDDESLREIYKKQATEAKEFADSYRQQTNNTATSYNDYILKNSYVWKDNVPADIYMRLEPISEMNIAN